MALFPEETGFEVVESLFPSEEEVTREVEKSKKYKLSLAERYAQHNNIPLNEALTAVEEGKFYDVFKDQDEPDLLEKAYAENFSPETFKATLETYQKNTQYIENAGESKDVIQNIVVDKYNPDVDQTALTMAILSEEFKANAPDESVLGYIGSFLGMFAREATVGVAENFLGTTGLSTGDWMGKSQLGREQYMQIFLEPDIAKKRILAREFAQQAKDMGIFGDNALLYWSRFNTINTMGTTENEGLWLAADVAGFVPIGKVLTLGKTAARTTGTTAKLALASDAAQVAEATGGKAAANQVVDTALNTGQTSINTTVHTAPSTSAVGSNGLGATFKPTLANEVANDYFEKIAAAYRGMYTPEMLQSAKTRYKNYLETKTKFHVLDIQERDLGLDNFAVKVTVGRDDGVPFKDWANAQKFAKPFGGKVEPYGVNAKGDGPEGYVVSFERNLGMKGLATPTQVGELRSSLFDILASPEITSSDRLNTILKRDLGKIGYIEAEIVKEHNNLLKKVSRADKRGLDQVISKLNVEDSDWYDLSTFKDVYFRQTGRQATKEVQDAYASTFNLAETARLLEADKILKRTTGERYGQFMGTGDGVNYYRMKRLDDVGNLPAGKDYPQNFVLDLDTGKIIDRKTLFEMKRTKKKNNLYQIVDVDNAPIIDGKHVLYATGSLKSSRPVTLTDVVPKIAGGFRETSNIHGFLSSKRIRSDLSGNVLNLTPNIVFVGRTAKELADAAKDIKTSLKALSDFRAGTLSRSAADDIIKANNGFNPNIEDLTKFESYLEKSGIEDDVEIVTKDMELPQVGVGQFENYRLGKFSTYEDLYAKGKLNNEVLYGYGSTQFKHLDTLVSVERDFAKGVNYMAEREYSYKAIEGFLKGAKANKAITNLDQIDKLPFVEQLRQAQFANSKAGDLFRTERRVIMNRLNETNEFAQAWNRRMQGFGEYIFDKSGFDIIDKTSFRPDVALRSFAFDLKMGLFNIDQLIVQGSAALSIMAISPVHGLKAAASYLPMRIAMINRNPEVLKALYKRSKAFIGMPEKDFLEVVDYMYKSGRFQVNQNISEINSTYDMTRGVIRNIRETGRVFFNEGDRIGRLMATNVAYRDFRKAYPTLDISTESGFRIMDDYITKRSDTLTMNMSRASAAGWQQGFLSLPTQWLGYQAKLMENIFFSRNLTAAEKTRLGLSQIAFFGAAGLPFASTGLNAFVDQTSEGINKDLYTTLRYGLLDLTLSNVTGEDTALSARLGTGEGLQQLWEDIMDKNFVEVIGGPAGSIAYDSGMGAIGLVASVFTTDLTLQQYDLNKVLRNVSSWNKATQAYYLMQTGEFINRKGQVLAEGMNSWNALWNTLGIPFQEVEMYYDLKQSLFAEKDMVLKVTERVRELTRLKSKYISEGDYKSAEGIRDEIKSLIAPLNFVQQKDVIMKSRESWKSLNEIAIQQDSLTTKQGLSRQFQKLGEQ